jgi:hypothetical protein
MVEQGAVLRCTEETERIINERSLKTLQEMDTLVQKED